MAPLLFRGMKGVNISCASPASTATCTSMDPRRSVVRQSGACRAIDRQVPHLRDTRRARSLKNWVVPPSPSKLRSYAQKSRKSADVPSDLISPAASSRYLLDDDDDVFFDVFPDLDPLPVLIPINSARFQSVAGDESPALRRPSSSSSSSAAAAASRRDEVYFGASSSSSSLPPTPALQVTKCSGDPPAVLGPSASTKYGEHLRAAAAAALPSAGFQMVKGDASPNVIKPSPSRRSQSQAYFRSSSSLSETRFHTTKGEEPTVLKPSSSARTRDQVVVLRVSLHCKGCEAKVKKHISRMEGVTSFSVDFATKKVTVIGDVTPLGVLSSISKVKNAQFWPSPPRPSTSS